MDVYFVRHGETVPNAAHRYQKPNELLSDSGSRDVAKLVHHIAALKPTHLYTSHFQRARQTADYLSYATDLQTERVDYLHELYRPEYLYGRSHFGLSSAWYILGWFFGFLENPDDSRVETRREFSERILQARTVLEGHDKDVKIVAVSHSVFINFFVAHACQNKPLSFWQAIPRLLKIFRTENTGVTHMRYNPAEDGVCGWQLVSYNGASHLD